VRKAKVKKSKGKGMALKIWMGNKLVDEQDAKISVFDHGLL
jgi:hypothetical protein